MKSFTIRVCKKCYELKPGMCNEPECVFCRRTQKEVSDFLDALLIRPVVDGMQLDLETEDESKDFPAKCLMVKSTDCSKCEVIGGC